MVGEHLNKIKILHIITRLDRGGSSENTLLTVLGLNRERYDIMLISGPSLNPSSLLDGVKTKNIKLIEIKQLIRKISPLNDLLALYKIYCIINKEKFQIVHSHTSKAGVLGRIAARLNKVPIIIHTPHGHLFYGYYGKFFSYCIIMIEKIMTHYTDIIIALTQREKEDYINYKVASFDRISSIYSGIEIEKFKNKVGDKAKKKQELGISQDSMAVGCVARLDYVKGQRYLLEAIPKIKGEIKDVKFLLVGDGPLKKDLQRQVELSGIKDSVIFLDDRGDCPEIISILDLLVLPSLNEGMGRVLLEAQAQGVPLVASKVGGIADIVIDGKTGILVPPKEPQILAETIIDILQDSSRMEKMKVEARNWVDARFSAKTMVEMIDNLYHKMVKERLSDVSIWQ